MAQRRMFSLKVVDTDDFLDMGQGSQLLYFHLAMRADDDGFVNSPKKIMRFAGAKDDDLKVLVAKQFIIPFQSGVIVIRHWKENNSIRKDRKQDTIYKKEMSQIDEDPSGIYRLSTKCQPDGNQVSTKCQHRIGKDRVGEDRIGKDRKETFSNENVGSNEPGETDEPFLVDDEGNPLDEKGKPIKKKKQGKAIKQYKNMPFPEPTWNEKNELIGMFNFNRTSDWMLSSQTERNAIAFLFRRIGYDKLKTAIKKSLEIQSIKYAPVITKPSELKEKFNKLLGYWSKEKSTNNNGAVEI